MKKILYFVLAAAMLAMFGCTGDTNSSAVTNPNPNPFTPKGTVSGVLRDTVTLMPIANATVAISDKTGVTDSRGLFTIYNVPANTAVGNEPSNGSNYGTYTVVIDMTNVNNAIKTGAKYPAFVYDTVDVSYTSLGETGNSTSTSSSNATSYTDSSGRTHTRSTTSTTEYPVLGFGGFYYPSDTESTSWASSHSSSTSNSSSNSNTNTTNTGTSGSGSNHDTPVDGFVANIESFAAHLDAAVTLQVVNAKGVAQANVPVTLYSTSNTAAVLIAGRIVNNNIDTAVGNTGKVVDTQTTAADGTVTFSGLEARRVFVAKADTGSLHGFMALESPSDNETSKYLNNQDSYGTSPSTRNQSGANVALLPDGINDSLLIVAADTVPPYVNGTSPANLADVTPDASSNVNVTFSFSEPIQQDPSTEGGNYALATTAALATNGGLYNDVYVNYDGPKAGNLAYTIKWLDAQTLQVSFTVQASSRYTVALLQPSSLKGLVDLSTWSGVNPKFATPGNALVYGAPSILGRQTAAVVTFSTNGTASLPAAPVLLANGTTKATWLAVANAWQYKEYLSTVPAGGTPGKPVVTTVSGSTLAYDGSALDYSAGKTYILTITAVSSAGVESLPSNALTLKSVILDQPVVTVDPTKPFNLVWKQVNNAISYTAYVTVIDIATGNVLGTSTVPNVAAQPSGYNNTIEIDATTAIPGFTFSKGTVKNSITIQAIGDGTNYANSLQSAPPVVLQDYTPVAPNAALIPGSTTTLKWSPQLLDANAIPNLYVQDYVAHIQVLNAATSAVVDSAVVDLGNVTTFNITAQALFGTYGYASADGTITYSYKVTIGAVTANKTAGALAGPFTFSDTPPGAVLGLVRTNNSKIFHWNTTTNAAYYEIQILTIQGTPGGSGNVVVATTPAQNPLIVGTPDLYYVSFGTVSNLPLGGPFVDASGNPIFYQVEIRAFDSQNNPGPYTVGSDISTIITEIAAPPFFDTFADPNAVSDLNGNTTLSFWNLFNFTSAVVTPVNNASQYLSLAPTADLTGALPGFTAGSVHWYGIDFYIDPDFAIAKSDIENLGHWSFIEAAANNNPLHNVYGTGIVTTSQYVRPQVGYVVYDPHNNIAHVWFSVTLSGTTTSPADPRNEIIQFNWNDLNGKPATMNSVMYNYNFLGYLVAF